MKLVLDTRRVRSLPSLPCDLLLGCPPSNLERNLVRPEYF
jgi:hypothetical protein